MSEEQAVYEVAAPEVPVSKPEYVRVGDQDRQIYVKVLGIPTNGEEIVDVLDLDPGETVLGSVLISEDKLAVLMVYSVNAARRHAPNPYRRRVAKV